MSDPKKVLICDDSIVMRKMINDILSRNGFNIVGQAKNGAEAIELYSKLQPDLVTMDIIMPGEPGVEIVKKIVHDRYQGQDNDGHRTEPEEPGPAGDGERRPRVRGEAIRRISAAGSGS